MSESEKMYCARADMSETESAEEVVTDYEYGNHLEPSNDGNTTDYAYGNMLEPTASGNADIQMNDKEENDDSDDDSKMCENNNNTNNVNSLFLFACAFNAEIEFLCSAHVFT